MYKDDLLQYILNEEGRSRPQAVATGSTAGQTKFVYDYFIKDHLGNVRSTIGAEPINSLYLARHEIATANAEQLIFDNIAAVRSDKPGSINPNDEKAVKLVANDPDKRIGTAIMLQVMPGDKFTFATDAYFESDQTPVNDNTSSEDIITSLVAALTGGTVGGVPVSESGTSTDIINNALGNVNLASQLNDIQDAAFTNQTGLRAGINYLFFDRNMRLIPQISCIIPVGNDPGLFNNVGTPEIATTEPGYVVVYVDNRSVGTDVWFDNVLISHYTGTVLDEEHYYPYGLTVAELHNNAFTDNPYKYNGKELEKSFGLEYYNYGARQFDPQRGQWTGIDPYAEKFYSETPFNYAGNNPVKYIDIDGKYKFDADNYKKYKESYPNVMYYIENYIHDDIMKSQTIIDGIYMHRGKPGEGNKYVNFISTWGKGPEIFFDPSIGYPINAHGEFYPEVNSMAISETDVKEIENVLKTSTNSFERLLALTKLFMTIVHESGHRANYADYKTVNGKDETVNKVADRKHKGDEAGDRTENYIWKRDGVFDANFDLHHNPKVIKRLVIDLIKTAEGRKLLPTDPNNVTKDINLKN